MQEPTIDLCMDSTRLDSTRQIYWCRLDDGWMGLRSSMEESSTGRSYKYGIWHVRRYGMIGDFSLL